MVQNHKCRPIITRNLKQKRQQKHHHARNNRQNSMKNIQRNYTTSSESQSQQRIRKFHPSDIRDSQRQLYIPDSIKPYTLTSEELIKLSQLSYLVPPTTPQRVESVSKSINNMVTWLSSITHITPQKSSELYIFDKYHQPNKTNNDIVNTDLLIDDKESQQKIPFFTPLTVLSKTVPQNNIDQHIFDNNTIDSSSLLRLRLDTIDKTPSEDVLTNAPYTDRSFYIAPKSINNEE